MRMLAITVLVTAQLLGTARPVLAAELVSEAPAGAQQRGAFAGARIRVPLGETVGKAQAGLTLAPTLRAGEKGELRFARGFELGLSGEDQVQVSLGGRPVSHLTGGGKDPKGKKLGISTIGWVAIGAGVAAAAFAGWFVTEMNEPHD